MPGGDHIMLAQTRQAVEQRARALLAALEQTDEPDVRTEDGAPRASPS